MLKMIKPEVEGYMAEDNSVKYYIKYNVPLEDLPRWAKVEPNVFDDYVMALSMTVNILSKQMLQYVETSLDRKIARRWYNDAKHGHFLMT